jgi:hypothetical protein
VKKKRKMGDLSDFARGQIVGARLAGASVTKAVTLLGVSREFLGLCRHIRIMGRNHQRRGTMGENQIW